jgi:hypothetical protein
MRFDVERAIEAGLRFRPRPHEKFLDYRKRVGRDAAARGITSDALLTIFEGFEWIRAKEEEERNAKQHDGDEYGRETVSAHSH